LKLGEAEKSELTYHDVPNCISPESNC